MKEFTSTVTLTFDINNHEAIDKNDYVRLLKLQYQELYNLEIKDYEITNIEVTTGQYQLLYNLMCDAYDRGYDQRPSIDTQTFDNLFDNVCNAKETYLSINCKGVRQIVEGKIELQETVKWDI